MKEYILRILRIAVLNPSTYIILWLIVVPNIFLKLAGIPCYLLFLHLLEQRNSTDPTQSKNTK